MGSSNIASAVRQPLRGSGGDQGSLSSNPSEDLSLVVSIRRAEPVFHRQKGRNPRSLPNKLSNLLLNRRGGELGGVKQQGGENAVMEEEEQRKKCGKNTDQLRKRSRRMQPQTLSVLKHSNILRLQQTGKWRRRRRMCGEYKVMAAGW